MGRDEHEIYVISDLHLGGFLSTDAEEGRGFRMFTRTAVLADFIRQVAERPSAELVINGDFVDFLAQGVGDGESWVPFIEDENIAAKALKEVIRGERDVFALWPAF